MMTRSTGTHSLLELRSFLCSTSCMLPHPSYVLITAYAIHVLLPGDGRALSMLSDSVALGTGYSANASCDGITP